MYFSLYKCYFMCFVCWQWCPGIDWEPIREMSSDATYQGMLFHSCLSSLSQFGLILGLKECNWCTCADLHLLGFFFSAGREWFIESSPIKSHARKKSHTHTLGSGKKTHMHSALEFDFHILSICSDIQWFYVLRSFMSCGCVNGFFLACEDFLKNVWPFILHLCFFFLFWSGN